MKTPTLALIIPLIILYSCTPSKQLQGTWKMTPNPKENTEVIIELDKDTYTFKVNGKETVRLDYKFENGIIISEEKPIVKDRDSLEVIQITKDKLTLNLKEKGKPKQRTFIRIE